MSTLDLETGDEEKAEKISKRPPRTKREPTSKRSTSRARGGNTVAGRENSSLADRLATAFDKIAAQLDARNDEELASAIREEKEPMAQGLVSITSTVKPLRVPLVLALDLTEPFLAFFRVGRILFVRAYNRRMQRLADQQATYEEQQQESPFTIPET